MADSKVCSADGCGKPKKSFGMCQRHYLKWRESPESGAKRCSQAGCEKSVAAHGLCSAHYQRLRAHGEPLAGRTPQGALLNWLLDVAAVGSDDCRIWPFTTHRNGYGRIRINGRGFGAHYVACEISHGPAPSKAHQAAHSCGVRGCCNPRHLRWATAAENHADKKAHGTHLEGESTPAAKVTADDVRWIRSNMGKITYRVMGEKLGIHEQSVYLIAKGRTWASVPP